MSTTHRRPPLLVIPVVLTVIGVAGWIILGQYGLAPTLSAPTVRTGALAGSGSIEADETTIAAEMGGRIREVLVDDGASVKAGDVLVRLDDSLLVAQIGQAQAAATAARAGLAQVTSGSRPEEVAAARANLAQATAIRDGAQRAWEDAKRSLASPQELDARIDGAKTQVAVANSQAIQARAALESAKVQRDRDPNVEANVKQVTAAEDAVRVAEASASRAQAQMASLQETRANPLAAQAQVDAAEAAYKVSLAAADGARARLDAVTAGPTAEQVAVAQAAVKQAESSLVILQVQQGKMTARAPIDGLVTSRTLHAGELASPGAPLLTLADLNNVRQTVYIAEDQIGRVRLGQQVQITVDSFPGRVFSGQVSFVYQQAEFTPKNVQTQKERASTVFGVRVRLANSELKLKPGMPADATFLQ
jgi:HlyD family secretion protein